MGDRGLRPSGYTGNRNFYKGKSGYGEAFINLVDFVRLLLWLRYYPCLELGDSSKWLERLEEWRMHAWLIQRTGLKAEIPVEC